MNQPSVLIVSDEAEFGNTITSRWQAERNVPAFTLLGASVLSGQAPLNCDVVIVGPVSSERLGPVLDALADVPQPVVLVAADTAAATQTRNRNGKFMVLRQHEGWIEPLALLVSECFRRIEMTHRAENAEKIAAEHAGHATLGRYMIDMRHSLNNALTSVLGNAELLLMDPETLTPEVRYQLQTIHSMSLRINEIIARFSSLENELKLARRDAQHVGTGDLKQAAGWTSF